jgi:hypothetical protein
MSQLTVNIAGSEFQLPGIEGAVYRIEQNGVVMREFRQIIVGAGQGNYENTMTWVLTHHQVEVVRRYINASHQMIEEVIGGKGVPR